MSLLLGGGGEGDGGGIDVPDASDSETEGGRAGRLNSDKSMLCCLKSGALWFDMMSTRQVECGALDVPGRQSN